VMPGRRGPAQRDPRPPAVPVSLTVRGSAAKAATLLLISLSLPRSGMRET